MLRQNDYSNMSGSSLLTTTQFGDFLNCSRITAHNIWGSGEFYSFPGLLPGMSSEPHQWKMIPLDMTVAFIEFVGGRGDGKPHGVKRGKDPADFLFWYEEAKRRGGHAELIDGKWYWLDRGDGWEPPVYRELEDDQPSH